MKAGELSTQGLTFSNVEENLAAKMRKSRKKGL